MKLRIGWLLAIAAFVFGCFSSARTLAATTPV
jgi:hypothetical protein